MRRESTSLDPEVQLGKRKPRREKPDKQPALFDSRLVLIRAFKEVAGAGALAKSKGRAQSTGQKGAARRQDRSVMQRCAVRISYADNKNNGTWAAHGRYIERDGAQYSKDEIHSIDAEGLENDREFGRGIHQRSYSDAPTIGSELPTVTGNHLHTLPELDVVGGQAGAEVLLSADSPYDMDGFREAYAARLRRLRAGDGPAPRQDRPAKSIRGSNPGDGRRRASVVRGRGDGLKVSRTALMDPVFSSDETPGKAYDVLREWEKAGDPRIFKFIVSPEFGERVDHRRLTRDLFKAIEADLGVGLQWVAVTHHNTDHPHTHVALRGLTREGGELRFSRQYLSHHIRQHAQAAVTRQLGYRSELDRIRAAQREVGATRVTSLDRMLLKGAASQPAVEGWKPVGALPTHAPRTQLVQRLEALETMGYARKSLGTWYVSENLQGALSAMQRATDRQRALRAGQLAVSDSRLPLVVTPVAKLNGIEGRILGHGEEDSSGKRYMLLESIAGKVHYVYHFFELAKLREGGGLKPGSYVVFKVRRQNAGGRWKAVLDATELGDAERLLSDPRYLRRAARGAMPDTVYGGWLGRRAAALRQVQAQQELERSKPRQER